ncbi:MAG: hypothetical protein CVU78_07505 [Elusimicrobia bacterium HGW-Elusimicrobia-2]|nr:MAG: hypothetical protein CVU78_07505 [Elusimicrobia bacterium HGW-Elusimicrobia-2]
MYLPFPLLDNFGKGFDSSNLWNMRKFYQTYPILDAVRRELSWTHFCATSGNFIFPIQNVTHCVMN